MSFKKNTRNRWAIALEKVLAKTVDDVPSDWLNVYQIGNEMGLSEEQAGKAVTLLKRSGQLEVKKFRIKTMGKTGLIKNVCHYRLISSAKETGQKVSASGKS